MFKKMIFGLVLSILIIGQFSFSSEAVGQSSNLTFNVNYPQPYCSETKGYISLVYYHAQSSQYRLNTLFWSIEPDFDSSNGTDRTTLMDITISGNRVVMQPWCEGGYYYSLFEYSSQDFIFLNQSGYYPPISNAPKFDYTYENLVGVVFGGNVGTCNMNGGYYSTPTIHWNNSPDANELYYRLNIIWSHLEQIDSDTSDIIDKLVDIYNQNVDINTKLDELKELYNQLIEEQEESNTWLEKIFNFLEEKDEKDKEAATQQGNQSTADIDDMITDDSAGFVDSLGGLTSSMSYTGTNCSWTFPTVKLPAISGVMDEVTLVESQEIDFTYWVNSIPSGILLLVQSVCTVALIVFCFKELYGAISYALTLKGGGNSE